MKIDILSQMTKQIPLCPIEKGILKMVGILNAKGLVTFMSCEGHHYYSGKSQAWIDLQPAAFKHYMKTNSSKMEQFLICGEGRWTLRLEYFGQSQFRGLGRPRPRAKNFKRIVRMEMIPRIILKDNALQKDSIRKTKSMVAMERAAQKYL